MYIKADSVCSSNTSINFFNIYKMKRQVYSFSYFTATLYVMQKSECSNEEYGLCVIMSQFFKLNLKD